MTLRCVERRLFVVFPGVFLLFSIHGCIATQGWVREQIAPVEERIAGVETRLGETDAKANRALERLDNLRLERRFVLSLKEGATFASSSAVLTEESKRAIAGFLGDLENTEDLVFLVAGHTDATGSEDTNYELGQKRAASVVGYLIRKGIDPLRVTAVSYGESSPLVNNTTQSGRQKNRRIEILVYRDGITTAPRETGRRAGMGQAVY